MTKRYNAPIPKWYENIFVFVPLLFLFVGLALIGLTIVAHWITGDEEKERTEIVDQREGCTLYVRKIPNAPDIYWAVCPDNKKATVQTSY